MDSVANVGCKMTTRKCSETSSRDSGDCKGYGVVGWVRLEEVVIPLISVEEFGFKGGSTFQKQSWVFGDTLEILNDS